METMTLFQQYMFAGGLLVALFAFSCVPPISVLAARFRTWRMTRAASREMARAWRRNKVQRNKVHRVGR